MFKDDLVTYLMADTGVSDAISTRLYPMELPQGGTLPAVAYQFVSELRGHTHGTGSDDIPDGSVEARIQFRCWASSVDSAYTTARAIRDALDGFRGWMADTRVDLVMFDQQSQARDRDQRLDGVLTDYIATYHE